MPAETRLSDRAIALLREYRGEIAITDANGDACRELAGQGMLVLCRPFVGEPTYRMTEMGVKLRGILDRINAPSPAGSAAPRR